MYSYPKAPRDRRQHKRLLTLKNAGRAAVVLAVLFVAASLMSEFRSPRQGKHGRLYDARTVDAKIPKSATPDPVVEEPIQPSAGANPLLLTSAAREQYLDAEMTPAEPEYTAMTARTDLPKLGGGSFVDVEDDYVERTTRPLRRSGSGRIRIAGDSGGVQIQGQ